MPVFGDNKFDHTPAFNIQMSCEVILQYTPNAIIKFANFKSDKVPGFCFIPLYYHKTPKMLENVCVMAQIKAVAIDEMGCC